ncbi:MAG: hypothetical protein WC637_05330, partial [Victivallales bacterium]
MNFRLGVWLYVLCFSWVMMNSSSGMAFEPANPPGSQLIDSKKTEPAQMRGFGQVAAKGWLWQDGKERFSLVSFTCQDTDTARILGSKYLEDLLAYGAVSLVRASPEIKGTMLQVRHGGVWLLGLNKNEVYVATAATAEKLRTCLAGWQNAVWQDVPRLAYPRYL